MTAWQVVAVAVGLLVLLEVVVVCALVTSRRTPPVPDGPGRDEGEDGEEVTTHGS